MSNRFSNWDEQQKRSKCYKIKRNKCKSENSKR